MGKSSPQAPTPIDASATARAQGAANKETAIAQTGLNAMNQYGPSGSLEYTQNGTWADGTPRFNATQTLTPQQQRIFDERQNASETYGQTGNALLNSVKGTLSNPVNLSSLGAAPTYDTAFRDQQRQALITRSQPQFDQQRTALETQLANQGLVPGTTAYNNAFDQYNRGYNDFLLASDLNAGNLAGNEYSRMQQSRQNQIGEMLLPRQQSLNELAALAGGSQLSTPSYVNTPQTGVQGTDIIGAQGLAANQQNALYQSQMGQNNAAMGGLFGLGGAALGGSLAGGYWG
jgi:hypothetical protein